MSSVPKQFPPQGLSASCLTVLRTDAVQHTLPAGTAAPAYRTGDKPSLNTAGIKPGEATWSSSGVQDQGVGWGQRSLGPWGDEREPTGDQDSP